MTSSRYNPDWASDTPPSAPVPPDRPRLVNMGGFCFTDGGIAHDISEVEAEAFRVPPIGPHNSAGTS